MASEVKTASRLKNSAVIRADKTQTGILKTAFTLSSVASSEQLKALSEETHLPEKWIHQWFVRQRVKERKSKAAVASTPTPGSAPDLSISISASASTDAQASTSAPILSAQEILHFKQENHDPFASISFLEPEPLPFTHVSPSEPGDPSGSEYFAVTQSVSASSGFLDPPPPPATRVRPARRKRGRAAKNQNQNQDPAQKATNVRSLRSKAKGRVTASPPLLQAEFVEPSPQLRYTPPAPEGMSFGPDFYPAGGAPREMISSAGLKHGACTGPPSTSVQYPQLLPMIAPAKRSRIQTRGSSLQSIRSGLSTNQSDSIYLPPPGSRTPQDGVQRHVGAALPPSLPSQPQRTRTRSATTSTAHRQGQGPVLRTQFQNNGPSDYSSSSSLTLNSGESASNEPDVSMRSPVPDTIMQPTLPSLGHVYRRPNSNYYISRPLAPAFDWENHLPSETSMCSIAGYEVPHFQQAPQLPQPMEYGTYKPAAPQETVDFPVAEPESFMYPPTELSVSDSFNGFLQGTILDPLVAPLKHLTDYLENFKDKQGTYLPLMMEQERGNLVACLLDERLAERNPFQAAMGLSLLSKLGIEWEV